MAEISKNLYHRDPWEPNIKPWDIDDKAPWKKTPKSEFQKTPAPFKPLGIDAWTIGFEDMWRMLESLNKQPKSTYPPYNIIKNDNDHYSLEIATAGFSKEDITITKEENVLIVEGNRGANDAKYVHRGIASRQFKQEFALADHIKVLNAELVDGILRIDLERELPEEKRPKVITIN